MASQPADPWNTLRHGEAEARFALELLDVQLWFTDESRNALLFFRSQIRKHR